MPMTADQLVTEIRGLSTEVRAEVLDRVLLESHGGQSPEITQAWSDEIHRRVDEIRNGAVEGVPGDEVSARLRRMLEQ